MKEIYILNAGTVPYKDGLALQYALWEKRKNNAIPDTLLLLEHPPVLTLGTRGDRQNIYLPQQELASRGIEIFETERGGDVTYHGPGQIVGYLFFDMREHDRNIRLLIQKIEQSIIRLLEERFQIQAHHAENKFTGVWVGEEKITAIGIAVKSFITLHGFAFNVNTDLSHFQWINPCGLHKGVTSLERLTGQKQSMPALFSLTAEYFAQAFDCIGKNVSLKDLFL